MGRAWKNQIAALGVTGLIAASCGSQPDDLTFTNDGSPVVTVAQTTTTLASVDVDIDFDKLRDALAELKENPAATTTIDGYLDSGELDYRYSVTYVPRSQYRYATIDYQDARVDAEAWINLDQTMVVPLQYVVDREIYLSNLGRSKSAGLPASEQSAAESDPLLEPRADLQDLAGHVEWPTIGIVPSIVQTEAAPWPLVTRYAIENQIVIDRAEIRETREIDGFAEFELVPDTAEPGRYYVMRMDVDGRLAMVDARLAGVGNANVVWIDYDVVDGNVEPPEAMTFDEMMALTDNPETWLLPIAGSAADE